MTRSRIAIVTLAVVAGIAAVSCVPPPAPPHPTTTTTTSTTVLTTPALTVGVTMTPAVYGNTTDVTVTVHNVGDGNAPGVQVVLDLPAGLSFQSGPAAYDQATSTWSGGSIGAGSSGSFTVTALVTGNLTVDPWLIQATATTTDPHAGADSGQLSFSPAGAPVDVTITPAAGNPNPIDVSAPGSVTFTAHTSGETTFPTVPAATFSWVCSTDSGNPCPFVDALANPSPTITFDTTSFAIDTYHLTAIANVTDPNFSHDAVQTTISFTTTNGGGS